MTAGRHGYRARLKIEDARPTVINWMSEIKAIGSMETQMGHITEVLTAEGVSIGVDGSAGTSSESVPDMAYRVLTERGVRKPIHYRELVDLMTAEGKLIPGRNPGSNLISHLSRDERFVRTGRGTYALAAWGLKPVNRGRRRRRKKPKK
jgi:hypothetical protein